MPWTHTLTNLARLLGQPAPARDAAFSGVSKDTRTLRPGELYVALRGENFDGDAFAADAFAKGAAAALCREPHAEGPCLLVPDPLAALQQFAAAHRAQHPIPIFALTGSCGKTTTKNLTAALLATKLRVVSTQGNLNNDIGCPLSLLQMDADTQMAVIEMGANHAGEIALLCALAKPTEAAVTLVAPAHLEGFGSIENVAAAKAEIVTGLGGRGCFYVNVDNPWCARMADMHAGEKIYFGSHGDVALRSCAFDDANEMLLDIAPIGKIRLPLPVRALASNVLLAVAVGLRHGVTDFEEPLRAACETTSRMKAIACGPITVLDDTYNANPASMNAAIETLGRWNAGMKIAALGSMLELGETAAALHREMGAEAARQGVARLYAFGPNAADIVDGAKAEGIAHAEACETHQAIAEAIAAVAAPGSALLLKGSRGMRMERVREGLETIFAAKG